MGDRNWAITIDGSAALGSILGNFGPEITVNAARAMSWWSAA
jgi:hypothetical protein